MSDITLPIDQTNPQGQQSDPNSAESIMARFEQFQAPKEPAGETQPEAEKPDATANSDEQKASEQTQPKEEEKTDGSEPQADKRTKGWMTEIKRKADEFDKKVPAMERELNELREKIKTANPAELDMLKSERDQLKQAIESQKRKNEEYEHKMALIDIRNSEGFKQEVIVPLQKIGGEVDRIAAAYGADANALKDALAITDPATQRRVLSELMAEFDEFDKVKIRGLVDKAQDILSMAAEKEANATEERKKVEFLKHQEGEQQKRKQQEVLSAARTSIENSMREKMPDIFSNESVQEWLKKVDLGDNNPTMLAYNAVSGQLLVPVINQLRAEQAKVKSLEESLKARTQASPKGGGGQTQQQTETQAKNTFEGDSVWARARAAGIAKVGQ